MTLEKFNELKEQDIGDHLERMIKGTNFEKELDAYFDRMEALGMSEEDILKQMMGGAQNKDQLDKGQAIEFDASDIKMDQQLFQEFEKVMKSHGVDKEM